MRTLLLALVLTLASAGGAHAQDRIRDAGPPAAQAGSAGDASAEITRQAGTRARVKAVSATRASRAQAARRQHAPRVKRAAAPRG